jgi:F420-non-reducing hydrogenase large subunit
LAPADLPGVKQTAGEAVDFARFTLQLFKDVVLTNDGYLTLITSEAYTHRTYYMGLVNNRNQPDFYAGKIRVVDPSGQEYAGFPTQHYLAYIGERVEPWTYGKFCFLKPLGWTGFVDGPESGVYAVAPLARLNVADGMATPEAQKAYEEYTAALGGKPVHHTLANHWARVIEMLQAAERMQELANDPGLTGTEIRTIPTATPKAGVGVVEAPRGTLIHHYETDEQGLIRKANLIVATQGNSARMAMGVEKSAKELIHNGKADDGLLNRIEMAFRAYDPCHGCATHSLPGQMPLTVSIRDAAGLVIRELGR